MKALTTALPRSSRLIPELPVLLKVVLVTFHVEVPLPIPTARLSCGELPAAGPMTLLVMLIVPLTAVPVAKSPTSMALSAGAAPAASSMLLRLRVKPLMLVILILSVPLLLMFM